MADRIIDGIIMPIQLAIFGAWAIRNRRSIMMNAAMSRRQNNENPNPESKKISILFNNPNKLMNEGMVAKKSHSIKV
jgi:hypothetical protein